mmetsp:Transcript_36842/g.66244  ORF Transcript_36842/g.66244 Transcript_36842/m.66244 type:complete len:423 (-) Transcript_36842:41-1309(-)
MTAPHHRAITIKDHMKQHFHFAWWRNRALAVAIALFAFSSLQLINNFRLINTPVACDYLPPTFSSIQKIASSSPYRSIQAAPPIKLAICAFVKDEAPYLAEWIEHHKMIGFDSILLYNDNSTDDTQCVLDAYAQKVYVIRIPEDTGSRYNVKFLPSQHDNEAQLAILESCRRFLVDEEINSGKVGSTWLLTNDIDEFLWFDWQFGSAKNALVKLLNEVSPWQPQVKSTVIPSCVFGTSGQECLEPGLVMKRFVHRDENMHCTMKGSAFAMMGKSISLVSSMVKEEPRVHFHKVSKPSRVDVYATGKYLKLAHYKTKSREEFYARLCNSRYVFKYFDPYSNINKNTKYPGCCSPSHFFDYVGDKFIYEDKLMLSFAEELELIMSKTAHHCQRILEKPVCPQHLMEVKNQKGLLNFEEYMNITS